MVIEIEALDTLFFRDGKPFEKGDDVWANGMFPPLPSVIYGALRSAYLGQNDIGLDEVEEATKGLRIRNIWYKVTTENIVNRKKRKQELIYLPLPLDLVQKKDLDRKQKKKAEKYHLFDAIKLSNSAIKYASKIKSYEDVINSNLTLDDDIEGLRDGLITSSNYEDYLKGKGEFEVRELNNHFHSESKIGIARNNATRTTSEGNLYRVGMLRTDKIKIYVEFDGLNLNNSGILKLGGENKLATYIERTDKSDGVHLRLSDLQLGELDTFKLCLATPTIFKNGLTPTEIFEKVGVEVELTTCAVGKSISVGGFNMKKTTKEDFGPKVMYKAVPAGSIYYYKILSGNVNDLEKAIKDYGVSEVRGNEGFGVAFIGKI